jgi:uncharacterized sulfatase
VARPSFVFIMTDTQGANVVGAYGHPAVRTPNIDRLAGQGVRFDQAFTTAPVCTPARAGLFTGIYAHAAGAWANNLPLGANVHTMGQRFRDVGYRTAYIGKWHLDGYDYFGTGECPDGWDPRYWYDGRNYLEDLGEPERRLWRGGLRSAAALRAHGITAEWTWAGRNSERAIRFLEEAAARTGDGADDAPFLLVVSYDEPHEPFTCPPEYVERFAGYRHPLGPAAHDDLHDKPAHHREWAASTRDAGGDGFYENPLYFGCNSFVDAEIGRVLAAPKPAAQDPAGPGSASGRAPAGGREAGRDEDRGVVIEFQRFAVNHDSWGGLQPIRCLVDADYKLVLNLLDTDELYDRRNDPAELTNLIGAPAHAAARDRLHDRLLDWMGERSDPFRGPAWERRPWRAARRLGWFGPGRARRPDGYAPPAIVPPMKGPGQKGDERPA